MPPAILAAGLTGAASIGGAFLSSGAAKHAADLQAQAAANALAFQTGIYNDTKTNMAPYLGVGSNAASTLSSIYGFGTGGPSSPGAVNSFMNTPDYQFTFNQGSRALDMSAAANHLLTSGGMVRAAQDYGQQAAGQQYGSTIQRLIQLMTLGQQGAASLGQTASQFGQMGGASMMAQGQAQASGVMGGINPFVSALNTGPGNALAAYSYFNNPAMQGGGGMFGGGNPFATGSSPVNSSSYVMPTSAFGTGMAGF